MKLQRNVYYPIMPKRPVYWMQDLYVIARTEYIHHLIFKKVNTSEIAFRTGVSKAMVMKTRIMERRRKFRELNDIRRHFEPCKGKDMDLLTSMYLYECLEIMTNKINLTAIK